MGHLDLCFRGEEELEEEWRGEMGKEEWEGMVAEVKAEVERRKARFNVMGRNKETIERQYLPLHSQLFDKCSELGVKKVGEKKKISDDIFTFPLFDETLCDLLVEELNHFKDSELAHSRPNSMNRYSSNSFASNSVFTQTGGDTRGGGPGKGGGEGEGLSGGTCQGDLPRPGGTEWPRLCQGFHSGV